MRDLITSVKEFNPAGGQPVIWTSNGYDPLHQLTTVTDDRNNITRSAYDNFGRRTIVDSPDAGRTETVYDLADNPIRKITSKLRASNAAIEYDYEFTRLTGIRYPIFPGNNVNYTYGAPGAAENAANRVTEVRDAAGTLTRGYGPLGELTRETRTVTAITGPARAYTTRNRFDTWNRVLQLTYPDSEVLTYTYDSGGNVNGATGVKGANNYTYLTRMDYDKFEQKVLQETGTGVRTTYSYDAADRRMATLRSMLPDGFQFQNLTYTYDNVGNITQLRNDSPLPHGKPIGGPSVQNYSYDDLYRLTSASGEYRNKDNKLDRYTLSLSYDTINNTTAKNQRHEIEVNPAPLSSLEAMSAAEAPMSPLDEPAPTDPALAPLGPIEEPEEEIAPEPGTQQIALKAAQSSTAQAQVQRRTTYDYTYGYGSGKPHAPSTVGPVNHAYDANGNLIDAVNTLPPAPGKRRQLVWDEENRLACNQDHNRNNTVPQDPSACGTPQQPATVRYVYDGEGNRVVKDAGPKHIYPNRNFSERNGTGFKHIFVGETRLLTKTVKPDETFENHVFYFHADHLGSSSYVTDEHANLTEHMEYFGYGETWVKEHPAQPTPVPYQYGAKEFDEETGLYYYGARYYNPRTQLWQSPDPALPSNLDGKSNPVNFALYTYANNNPIHMIDPNGESAWDYVTWNRVVGAAKLVGGVAEAAGGVAIGVATSWTGVGAVGGGLVAAHGIDVAISGARQLWSDEDTSSGTSTLMQAAGVPRPAAELIDSGLSLAGGLAGSAVKLLPRALAAEGAGTSYASYRAFLRAHGPADPTGQNLRQWHHIVEQGQPFAASQINNTENLVNLPTALHTQISAYYSSIQPFTNGLTVRAWLRGQTWAAQLRFGKEVIERFAPGYVGTRTAIGAGTAAGNAAKACEAVSCGEEE